MNITHYRRICLCECVHHEFDEAVGMCQNHRSYGFAGAAANGCYITARPSNVSSARKWWSYYLALDATPPSFGRNRSAIVYGRSPSPDRSPHSKKDFPPRASYALLALLESFQKTIVIMGPRSRLQSLLGQRILFHNGIVFQSIGGFNRLWLKIWMG